MHSVLCACHESHILTSEICVVVAQIISHMYVPPYANKFHMEWGGERREGREQVEGEEGREGREGRRGGRRGGEEWEERKERRWEGRGGEEGGKERRKEGQRYQLVYVLLCKDCYDL